MSKMTKNELIVESCRNMAFQDLRDTLSAALDDRDATIAELRAEVERLKVILEANSVNPNQMVLNADSRDAELTQLREDRRVLARYVNFIDQYFGATEEEGCLIWMNCDNEVLCEHEELSDAVDKSGALGRANG